MAVNGSLVDSFFRTLIYLRIIQNYSNYGDGDIDARLFALFGSSIRMEDMGDMRMAYFITTAIQTALIEAIIYKKVLPRPMAVLGLVVSDVTGPMFAFTDYTEIPLGISSPYAYGFSDYADYVSLSGQILSYDQMAVA